MFTQNANCSQASTDKASQNEVTIILIDRDIVQHSELFSAICQRLRKQKPNRVMDNLILKRQKSVRYNENIQIKPCFVSLQRLNLETNISKASKKQEFQNSPVNVSPESVFNNGIRETTDASQEEISLDNDELDTPCLPETTSHAQFGSENSLSPIFENSRLSEITKPTTTLPSFKETFSLLMPKINAFSVSSKMGTEGFNWTSCEERQVVLDAGICSGSERSEILEFQEQIERPDNNNGSSPLKSNNHLAPTIDLHDPKQVYSSRSSTENLTLTSSCQGLKESPTIGESGIESDIYDPEVTPIYFGQSL